MEPEFNYRIYKSLPPVPVMNPIHSLQLYFLEPIWILSIYAYVKPSRYHNLCAMAERMYTSYSFLTSALDDTLCRVLIPPPGRGLHWIEGWMVLTASLHRG
jgi:hypothetical protein